MKNIATKTPSTHVPRVRLQEKTLSAVLQHYQSLLGDAMLGDLLHGVLPPAIPTIHCEMDELPNLIRAFDFLALIAPEVHPLIWLVVLGGDEFAIGCALDPAVAVGLRHLLALAPAVSCVHDCSRDLLSLAEAVEAILLLLPDRPETFDF